ncbi:uncharacterized protein LOC128222783 [Mya arenaria]|uniref:uncharacterized protein LOC128222783 n=1 Tax=Mya arenaria TaxID=6604 RepID=UPI0022E5C37F|nr:uncharacterized protein LOC128222783 [Mya arenaria]
MDKRMFGVLLFLGLLDQSVAFVCDEGSIVCYAFSGYNNKSQWATCLTKDYIEEKSREQHTCMNQTTVYCYYQCMLEQHGLEEGPVYADCSCRPGYALPTVPRTPLPSWCSSPNGSECNWYKDCLEERFPCVGTEASYAISYGEKFCNLYSENYNGFDKIGQDWIDAVRKCLQVALVPLIRPYNTPSCDEIKTLAFQSHSKCYVDPFPDAPSFCDIGWSNFFRVLITIKSSIISEFWATIGQGLETFFKCGKIKISNILQLVISNDESTEDIASAPYKLEKSFKEYSKINIQGAIDVFFYPFFKNPLNEINRDKRSTHTSGEVTLSVLLLDRAKYDLNYQSSNTINLTDVATRIINDIETGEFRLGVRVDVKEVRLCADLECINATQTVTPPPEQITGLPDQSFGVVCDEGSFGCYAFPDYNNKYQWSTCLTKDYIEEKSRENHTCTYRTAVYCYYQCMLEQHGLEEGPVYPDCSCRPGYALPTVPRTPLPSWCSSPDGSECNWYKECLEERFPCVGTEASYAISYGEKFCNLYSENYNGFDKIGQDWIDGVRKCLQVALVPLIRPYNTPSCGEIKTLAFQSHSKCYVDPFPDAPSFCDIGWSNFFRVLITIKSSIISEFWATIGQGLETFFKCGKIKISNILQLVISNDESTEDIASAPYKLEKSFREYSKINIQGAIDVFFYPFFKNPLNTNNRNKRSTHTSGEVTLSVLLLDRAKYDLNYQSSNTINLTDVATRIINDIETGEFRLGVRVDVKKVRLCPDLECINATQTVTPPPEPSVGTIVYMQIYYVMSFVLLGAVITHLVESI